MPTSFCRALYRPNWLVRPGVPSTARDRILGERATVAPTSASCTHDLPQGLLSPLYETARLSIWKNC